MNKIARSFEVGRAGTIIGMEEVEVEFLYRFPRRPLERTHV